MKYYFVQEKFLSLGNSNWHFSCLESICSVKSDGGWNELRIIDHRIVDCSLSAFYHPLVNAVQAELLQHGLL